MVERANLVHQGLADIARDRRVGAHSTGMASASALRANDTAGPAAVPAPTQWQAVGRQPGLAVLSGPVATMLNRYSNAGNPGAWTACTIGL